MSQETKVIIQGITPELKIQSEKQSLLFDEVLQKTKVVLNNNFESTQDIPAYTGLEFRFKEDTNGVSDGFGLLFSKTPTYYTVSLHYIDDTKTEQDNYIMLYTNLNNTIFFNNNVLSQIGDGVDDTDALNKKQIEILISTATTTNSSEILQKAKDYTVQYVDSNNEQLENLIERKSSTQLSCGLRTKIITTGATGNLSVFYQKDDFMFFSDNTTWVISKDKGQNFIDRTISSPPVFIQYLKPTYIDGILFYSGSNQTNYLDFCTINKNNYYFDIDSDFKEIRTITIDPSKGQFSGVFKWKDTICFTVNNIAGKSYLYTFINGSLENERQITLNNSQQLGLCEIQQMKYGNKEELIGRLIFAGNQKKIFKLDLDTYTTTSLIGPYSNCVLFANATMQTDYPIVTNSTTTADLIFGRKNSDGEVEIISKNFSSIFTQSGDTLNNFYFNKEKSIYFIGTTLGDLYFSSNMITWEKILSDTIGTEQKPVTCGTYLEDTNEFIFAKGIYIYKNYMGSWL